jgi:transposase InsO family protein
VAEAPKIDVNITEKERNVNLSNYSYSCNSLKIKRRQHKLSQLKAKLEKRYLRKVKDMLYQLSRGNEVNAKSIVTCSRLSKNAISKILGKIVSNESYKHYIKGSHISDSTEDNRFYLNDISINDFQTQALIDTGSEVSLISLSLIKLFLPNWRDFPNSNSKEVIAHNGGDIPIISWKLLPFKLNNESQLLWWTFGIQKQDDNVLLIGNDFIEAYKAEFLRIQGKMHLSVPRCHKDKEGKTLLIALGTRTESDNSNVQIATAHNVDAVMFQPFETKIVKLSCPILPADSKVIVSALTTGNLEGTEIVPTLTDVAYIRRRPIVQVQVANLTGKVTKVNVGQLQCSLESLSNEQDSTLIDIASADKNILQNLSKDLNKGKICYVRQVLSSQRVQVEVRSNSSPKEHNQRVKHKDPIPDDIYNNAEKLNCDYELATDAITNAPPTMDPIEKVPLDKVDPIFHPHCLEVLNKHKDLLAKSQLDAGNCSKTLGYMYIPLDRKLPKCTKIFHAGLAELKIMQDLLMSMIKANIIAKATANSYGSPCFLLQKKSRQSTCRFIVSLTALNDCLSKPVNVLPNMSRVVESIASHGPSLMTTLDMSSGFSSLRIYPGHQNRVCMITPFGVYKYLVAPQGLSSSPTYYQAKVLEALNTCENTGKPDPIPNVDVYLDDVTCTVPLTGNLTNDINAHKRLLDKVMTRLYKHGFKINPSKLVMFQRKTTVLGHTIENGIIKVDESRFDKMANAPKIHNRKTLQMWLGFLASIKHFSPIELTIPRATLTELLEGNNKQFKWEERHELAFQKIKEILSKGEFIVSSARPDSIKILFTDASNNQSGAILLEAEFIPKIELVVPQYTGRIVPKTDDLYPALDRLNLVESIGLAEPTPEDGNCFFHAVLDQMEHLRIERRPKNIKELRMAIISMLDNHPNKLRWRETLKRQNIDWHALIHELGQFNQPTDEFGLTIQAAADYLRRNIIVIEVNNTRVQVVEGLGNANVKPPIWLALYRDPSGYGHFQSLICALPNFYSPFTTHHTVDGDDYEMSQENILKTVKDIIKKKTETRHKLKVIAYDSAVVRKADRDKPIYQLELAAIIHYLHKFKPYIRNAPACICVIDSSVAYFLTDPKVNISSVKSRRINVLLGHEYTNLLFHLVPSNQNWSDLFSRYWTVEPEVERAIKFKDVKQGKLPEFDEQLLTLRELQILSERANANIPSSIVEKPKTVKTQVISLKAQEALQNYTSALKILAKRLDKSSIITAQRKTFEFLRNNQKVTNLDPAYTMENGMLMHNGKILIPDDLIPLVLAYEHLLSGHAGRDRLYGLINEKYHFPSMHAVIEKFCKQCHTCFVNNYMTGQKLKYGSYPIPKRAFETIFLDLMEGVTANSMQTKYYLIITDYLSRAVFVFPMKSKSPEQLKLWLKIFFMLTNLSTKVCLSDNGMPFRAESIINFLSALGIKMPQTLPYHPQSRGVVEVSVGLVKMLLKKLLITNSNHDSSEIFFLSSLLLNNSYKPSIKACPSEVIYGSRSIELGSLGSANSSPALESKLLTGPMKVQVEKLREVIDARVKLCRAALEESRKKYQDKINKSKAETHNFQVNDIVFIKNLSLPPSGVSSKFRPTLYKSPFLVLRTGPFRLTVMRLTDNLTMLVHPDRARKFNLRDPLFDSLPQEVKSIVGSTLTPEKLEELAQIDELDALYVDHLKPDLSKPQTRQQTRQQALLDDNNSDNENENDASAAASQSDSKQVTFANSVSTITQPHHRSQILRRKRPIRARSATQHAKTRYLSIKFYAAIAAYLQTYLQ